MIKVSQFNYTWLYNCWEGVANLIDVCLQYKHQHQLNTVKCASPQLEQHNRSKSKPFHKICNKTPWQFANAPESPWLRPAVKIWCSAGQSKPWTCYFLLCLERKTNCTLNKTWAVQDVVTVWQKPSYWLPAKPDHGDLTPKGCLQLSFFETLGWAAYRSWSGCDALAHH